MASNFKNGEDVPMRLRLFINDQLYRDIVVAPGSTYTATDAEEAFYTRFEWSVANES
jgi:hypothetical protein